MQPMISLIGFGEAGSGFAAAAGWGGAARAFDIRPVDYGGVAGCGKLADAVGAAPLVLSLVSCGRGRDRSGATSFAWCLFL